MSTSTEASNMLVAATAVGFGAALGALLRWQLGDWLNHLNPSIPPGTLVANLLGGYLVGVSLAWLGQHPDISPIWRLLLVTGFLGGLTTFSTFSAEVMSLLQNSQWGKAGLAATLHLAGSLMATWAGWATFGWLVRPHTN